MTTEETESSGDRQVQARRLALQQLRTLQRAGVDFLPRPDGRFQFADLSVSIPQPIASSAKEQDSTTQQATKSLNPQETPAAVKEPASTTLFAESAVYQSDSQDLATRIQQLEVINRKVADCTKCSELASCRTNTVFGVGSPEAELCFLGEGPGADEDRQGEPFVGRAGQLLDKIIAACKMSREDVYILNTVKCRPPGNRNPNKSELENCWPYAIQQLELIHPRFICCLGSVAARTLLQTTQSIGRMRGQFFKYRGSQVAVTYHPAYLLRNPSAKRQVWDDMKMLMTAMGRDV